MNISNSNAPSSLTAESSGSSLGGLEGQIAGLQSQIQSAKTDPKTDAKRVQQLEAALRQLEVQVRQQQEREAMSKIPPFSEESAPNDGARPSWRLLDTKI